MLISRINWRISTGMASYAAPRFPVCPYRKSNSHISVMKTAEYGAILEVADALNSACNRGVLSEGVRHPEYCALARRSFDDAFVAKSAIRGSRKHWT